jgi:hypothetical protein
MKTVVAAERVSSADLWIAVAETAPSLVALAASVTAHPIQPSGADRYLGHNRLDFQSADGTIQGADRARWQMSNAMPMTSANGAVYNPGK